MTQNVLSITQLNEYIQRKLDSDTLLAQVAVRGEISNYKMYLSGHHYFAQKAVLRPGLLAGKNTVSKVNQKTEEKLLIRFPEKLVTTGGEIPRKHEHKKRPSKREGHRKLQLVRDNEK